MVTKAFLIVTLCISPFASAEEKERDLRIRPGSGVAGFRIDQDVAVKELAKQKRFDKKELGGKGAQERYLLEDRTGGVSPIVVKQNQKETVEKIVVDNPLYFAVAKAQKIRVGNTLQELVNAYGNPKGGRAADDKKPKLKKSTVFEYDGVAFVVDHKTKLIRYIVVQEEKPAPDPDSE